MGDWGIRISHDGVDVKTGSDRDMILTSSRANLKGAFSGEGIVGFSENNEYTEIRTFYHNFGFIPIVDLFFHSGYSWEHGSFEKAPLYGYWEDYQGHIWEVGVKCRADAQKVEMYFHSVNFTGATPNMRYKFFIYKDKANLW